MPRQASEEIKQQWKDKIQIQRESGLSIVVWCDKNNISIHTFNYWKDKLFPRPSLNRASFSEITQLGPKNTAVTIEYHGFQVRIDSNFDPAALKKCLKILREVC